METTVALKAREEYRSQNVKQVVLMDNSLQEHEKTPGTRVPCIVHQGTASSTQRVITPDKARYKGVVLDRIFYLNSQLRNAITDQLTPEHLIDPRILSFFRRLFAHTEGALLKIQDKSASLVAMFANSAPASKKRRYVDSAYAIDAESLHFLRAQVFACPALDRVRLHSTVFVSEHQIARVADVMQSSMAKGVAAGSESAGKSSGSGHAGTAKLSAGSGRKGLQAESKRKGLTFTEFRRKPAPITIDEEEDEGVSIFAKGSTDDSLCTSSICSNSASSSSSSNNLNSNSLSSSSSSSGSGNGQGSASSQGNGLRVGIPGVAYIPLPAVQCAPQGKAPKKRLTDDEEKALIADVTAKPSAAELAERAAELKQHHVASTFVGGLWVSDSANPSRALKRSRHAHDAEDDDDADARWFADCTRYLAHYIDRDLQILRSELELVVVARAGFEHAAIALFVDKVAVVPPPPGSPAPTHAVDSAHIDNIGTRLVIYLPAELDLADPAHSFPAFFERCCVYGLSIGRDVIQDYVRARELGAELRFVSESKTREELLAPKRLKAMLYFSTAHGLRDAPDPSKDAFAANIWAPDGVDATPGFVKRNLPLRCIRGELASYALFVKGKAAALEARAAAALVSATATPAAAVATAPVSIAAQGAQNDDDDDDENAETLALDQLLDSLLFSGDQSSF